MSISGCGPSPALAAMLRVRGYEVRLYDPAYTADDAALEQRYDFVTATEVVEHVHYAAALWPRLLSLLGPGAPLVVMTKRVRDEASFAGWHYIRDPTHVRFYALQTFEWIAARYGAALSVEGAWDVKEFSKERISAPSSTPVVAASPPSWWSPAPVPMAMARCSA